MTHGQFWFFPSEARGLPYADEQLEPPKCGAGLSKTPLGGCPPKSLQGKKASSHIVCLGFETQPHDFAGLPAMEGLRIDVQACRGNTQSYPFLPSALCAKFDALELAGHSLLLSGSAWKQPRKATDLPYVRHISTGTHTHTDSKNMKRFP